MSAAHPIDETAVARDSAARQPAPSLPVATIGEFLAVVAQSRLVSHEIIEQIHIDAHENPNSTPSDIAVDLVQGGYLTFWQSQQLLAGKTEFFLGRYKFLDRLGVGGMGAVFKAEHEMMGRIVALKMVRRRLLEDDKTRKRFLREIKAVAALQHPNIVLAYDADCVANVYFLVLEYIDGNDLGWWVQQKGPFSSRWACEFARQVALGLQHAHERGLVHRDIKPTNLLAVREPAPKPPTIKILDFGLSLLDEAVHSDDLVQAAEAAADRHVTSVVGTFGFMAPEQFQRPPQMDIRSDIFSLGCTFFYLLTGRLPFDGDSDKEYLHNMLTSEPLAVSSMKANVPPQVDLVLAKMLARHPDDRFQTPAEVAAMLKPLAASPPQDFAAARNSAPLSSAVSATAPTAAMSMPEVDSLLGEFADRMTNQPTDITGSPLDELLLGITLPAAGPLPGFDMGQPPGYQPFQLPSDGDIPVPWIIAGSVGIFVFMALLALLLWFISSG